ncbi:MAG: putative S-layer associated protein [Cyanobacteria bacterium RYN_339]|nr:putative S-layer associated protein [Cyanobacteria bacterium RYN_339]
MLVACTVPPTAPPPSPHLGLDAPGAAAGLARLNGARTAAGLPPVELDDARSQAAAAHASYLRQNVPDRRTTTLDVHTELPTLPGWTPEGAAAAATADIGWRGDLFLAVDSWLGTLYHRLPLLAGRVDRVGFATVQGATSPIHVLAFGTGGQPALQPVLYPGDGEADVPINFTSSGESTDPVPGGAAQGVGFPITAGFPAALTQVKGSLQDAAGTAVPCHVSDPEHPATEHPQGNTICLIPKDVLAPATRYTATVTAASGTWRWTFTTTQPERVPAGEALAGHNRRLVTLQGHFGTPHDNAYLALPLVEWPGSFVIIQHDAWRKFAAAGFPATLAGRAFEASGVVDVDEGVALVSVFSPGQMSLPD